ncbi:MAG: hypothetical protein JOZ87_21190, partial [Chloroflexi bacterium]|nr:hypothetical protein [Chloroflexota bacterium]
MPRPTLGTGPAGGGPTFDLGPLLDALNPAALFGTLLTILAQQLAAALQAIADRLWHSGINVFTYTDPALTYSFGPVATLLTTTRLLIAAVTAIAIVLAAASLAGRELFGWGGELGEHLGRIGLAATLANGAGVLVQLAIDFNNQLCEAIGGTALQPPFGDFNFDPLSTSILLIVVLFFGLKLAFK